MNLKDKIREIFKNNHVGFPIIMQDGVEVPYEPLENALNDMTTLYTEEITKGKVINFEWIKEGFVGFSIDGGGVWYALFDVESAFWKFLNRNTRSKGFERPLDTVGRYSYKGTTEINELISWLTEEYSLFLPQQTKGDKE